MDRSPFLFGPMRREGPRRPNERDRSRTSHMATSQHRIVQSVPRVSRHSCLPSLESMSSGNLGAIAKRRNHFRGAPGGKECPRNPAGSDPGVSFENVSIY